MPFYQVIENEDKSKALVPTVVTSGDGSYDGPTTEEFEGLNTSLQQLENKVTANTQNIAKKADSTATTNALNLKANTSDVNTALATKADKSALTTVTNELAKKADAATMTTELAKKADTTTVNTELAKKANTTDVNNSLNTKADKTTLTAELAKKANTTDLTKYMPIAGGTFTGAITFLSPSVLKAVNCDLMGEEDCMWNLHLLDSNNIYAGSLTGGQGADGWFWKIAGIKPGSQAKPVYTSMALIYPKGDGATPWVKIPTPATNASAYAAYNKAALQRDYMQLNGAVAMTNQLRHFTGAPVDETPSTAITTAVSKRMIVGYRGDAAQAASGNHAVCWIQAANNNLSTNTRCYGSKNANSLELLVKSPKSATEAAYRGLALFSDGLGNVISDIYPPRETYLTDEVDTFKASMARHPYLFANGAGAALYVGGANASDTANLYVGRGHSADKPFATLGALINYAKRLHTGYVDVVAQANISFGGNFSGDIPRISIRSASADNKVTFTFTNNVNVLGSCSFYDIKLAMANYQLYATTFQHNHYPAVICLANVDFTGTNIHIRARGPHAAIIVQGNITVNGTASSGGVVTADQGGYILAHVGTWSGTVTGKRYHVGDSSTILTGNRGANVFPGSVAGTIEGNGHYY